MSSIIGPSIRRRSSSGPHSHSHSSSDESSVWSPPDTPTPIRHIPFNGKPRLQAGRAPSSSLRSASSGSSPGYSDLPVIKKRVSSSSFKTYRAGSGSGEDTEIDSTDEEVEEDALSDVESNLNAPHSETAGTSTGMENEGDEVDRSLYETKHVPSSPGAFWMDSPGTNDRKGKKRARDFEEYMQDGDDEMETEGILSVKQRGKRPMKTCKQVLTYPKEKSSAIGPNHSIVGNICNKMDGLRAASTIMAMNVDVPLLDPSTAYPREKHPDLLAFEKASPQAGAGVDLTHVQSQKLRHKRLLRKRGEPKRHFQQLTASDDPLVNLPAFRDWENSKIKFGSSPTTSAMDISDAEEVDQEMRSLTDIETTPTAGGQSSDIDMKSVSSLTPSIRSLQATPRKHRQSDGSHLGSVDIALKKFLTKRSRPRHAFAERASGQSTSQLHRSSPSSLLPARKYMTRSHKPISITHTARNRPDFPQIGPCILGQTFISVLRATLSARRSRRFKILAYNVRTADGDWKRLTGAWWGCEQVRKSADKWWLAIRGPDEVEVEALLEATSPNEDETMLSPSSSPKMLVPATKRVVDDISEEAIFGSEVEERWARRNELRQQELAPYVLSQRLQLQARRAENRRARAEAIRHRLAEIAEHRRVEEVQRRENLRQAEQERRRAEEARLEQEQQDRIRAAAILSPTPIETPEARDIASVPASPARSESSVVTVISEPPEYEFPFHSIASARSMPRIRRMIIRPDVLPDYAPDRWNNRSPPPPPPYNARTDCQTLIAPVFIEDDEDDDDHIDTRSDGEDDGEEALISPMIASRVPTGSRRRIASPEPRVIGSFPSRALFQPTPIPARSRLIDPIRSFENALELEEGIEEETDDVEGHLDGDAEEGQEEAEDVGPTGRVAGVFQRVFGLVWGGSRR
ncbi:uncharacterized protein I303_106137 [Kwoniella dejecticola CBS 10117]|uniref:Uncharacterized protein n=1 Tax=Kwoniella dejecticola CBS 10117 TaxID=1296121 RepID=A0A1A6A1E1_9TREE|nr:uncharacterized protein I303_06155 [Kwoniella dejecticola CBS 10117]OBR83872.1 hypothetical protein I303_06155 [Kwoniella dejecticola CBS 10117]